MEVTQQVEKALEEMKPLFTSEEIGIFPGLHRPANFIETAINNVKFSLLLGGALVAIVLFLFLLDLRIALISFVSIPLSLLGAVVVLNAFGTAINTMTLGGFAVAIGVVVDDPHTFVLEDGGRIPNLDRKRTLRAQVDPAGLLNPGKMRTAAVNPFAAA